MRKTLKLTLLAGAAALTVALVPGSAQTASAGAAGVARPAAQSFHVVFSPFDYTDLGQPGPSSADVIVFHDQLFKGQAKVGDEVGSCTLVDATGLSDCTGVVRLDGRGTIAFAFVNSPPPHKELAITGGSGEFRTAGGDGTLDENADGTGTLVLRVAARS